MTGSISRKLYRQVLLLYPEPFRHEFGDEMLSIFEECRAAQGSWHVFADVLLSAAKQQIHYLSIPAPKSAPLYSEIASSPRLARILAVAVFAATLIAGVFVGGKPKAPESWTARRPEPRFWFPTIASKQSCSDALEHVRNQKAHLLRMSAGNIRPGQATTGLRRGE